MSQFNQFYSPELEPLRSPASKLDHQAVDRAIENIVKEDAARRETVSDHRNREHPVVQSPVDEAKEAQVPASDIALEPTQNLSTATGFGLRFRPSWKLSALILAAALIIGWPGVIVSLILLSLLSLLIAYWTIGHDRSAELATRWFAWYQSRYPEQAAKLRQRGENAARGLERLFARLPERWTNGLYLPDFEQSQELPEKMRHDPFERLGD